MFGGLEGIFALGVTDGRETVTLAKWGKTFCCPIELMGAPSFVCYLEVVTAGIEARREADMESVTGTAIPQQSPSFSTLMALPDCTLSNKAPSEKADLARSFSKSQTLVATKFITIQQLVCLHTARESFTKNIILVAVDRASPALGA